MARSNWITRVMAALGSRDAQKRLRRSQAARKAAATRKRNRAKPPAGDGLSDQTSLRFEHAPSIQSRRAQVDLTDPVVLVDKVEMVCDRDPKHEGEALRSFADKHECPFPRCGGTMRACTCGEPWTKGITHTFNGPCYTTEGDPRD